MFRDHMKNLEGQRWQKVLEMQSHVKPEHDEEVVQRTVKMLNQHRLIRDRSYLQSKNRKDFTEGREPASRSLTPTTNRGRSQTPHQGTRAKPEGEDCLKQKYQKMKDRVEMIRKGKIRLKSEIQIDLQNYLTLLNESPQEEIPGK